MIEASTTSPRPPHRIKQGEGDEEKSATKKLLPRKVLLIRGTIPRFSGNRHLRPSAKNVTKKPSHRLVVRGTTVGHLCSSPPLQCPSAIPFATVAASSHALYRCPAAPSSPSSLATQPLSSSPRCPHQAAYLLPPSSSLPQPLPSRHLPPLATRTKPRLCCLLLPPLPLPLPNRHLPPLMAQPLSSSPRCLHRAASLLPHLIPSPAAATFCSPTAATFCSPTATISTSPSSSPLYHYRRPALGNAQPAVAKHRRRCLLPTASPNFYRLQPCCHPLPPPLLSLPPWSLLPLLHAALFFLHRCHCFLLPNRVDSAPINRQHPTSPVTALAIAATTSSFPCLLRSFLSRTIYAAHVFCSPPAVTTAAATTHRTPLLRLFFISGASPPLLQCSLALDRAQPPLVEPHCCPLLPLPATLSLVADVTTCSHVAVDRHYPFPSPSCCFPLQFRSCFCHCHHLPFPSTAICI
ncbi:hypothetical protein GW17_00020312 [Ensete ventricosum]|nr:hypothetical protein GW17_00020312 [Ensete ventricosum]